jgi:hypothetical protein
MHQIDVISDSNRVLLIDVPCVRLGQVLSLCPGSLQTLHILGAFDLLIVCLSACVFALRIGIDSALLQLAERDGWTVDA